MKRRFLFPSIFVFLLISLTLIRFSGIKLFSTFVISTDSNCHCKPVRMTEEASTANRSLCGPVATARGPGQKIISYSFFGSIDSSYFIGIEINLKNVRIYYPGYAMRLYLRWTELTKEQSMKICDLFCQESILDLCDVGEISQYPFLKWKHGRLWRFSPMADPLCKEWHSRDLDSNITVREVAAVKDWKSTNYSFHVMRDYKMHGVPILAGMFGMRITSHKRTKIKTTFENILKFSRNMKYKQLDQDCLSKFLWPLARNDMAAHDSYLCLKYPNKLNRPWPTRRLSGPNFSAPEIGNFVGSKYRRVSLQSDGPCPKQCRPKEHRDWLLC